MGGDEGQGLLFGLGEGLFRGLHLGNKTRILMVFLVPIVHGIQDGIGLVDHQGGALGHQVEVLIGNEGGDLQDHAGLGVQTGHFHVHPDQVGL